MEAFDPFALLGLERRYNLDSAAIERAYLAKTAEAHPDIAGPEADEHIEAINRARQVLADPEQRAVALWKLSGGVDDKALPAGFLVEMMEVREQIEGAKGDARASAKWGEWAEARRREYQASVGRLFASMAQHTAAPARADWLRRIKVELNAWRYIERLVEQLGE